MLRIVAINVLMFALPFLVYGIYYYIARRGAKDGGKDSTMWSEAPILWLLGAGGALMLVVMVSLISFSGGGTDATYVPSRVEDGMLKPGGFQ